jgi:hypothetical protein
MGMSHGYDFRCERIRMSRYLSGPAGLNLSRSRDVMRILDWMEICI